MTEGTFYVSCRLRISAV